MYDDMVQIGWFGLILRSATNRYWIYFAKAGV